MLQYSHILRDIRILINTYVFIMKKQKKKNRHTPAVSALYNPRAYYYNIIFYTTWRLLYAAANRSISSSTAPRISRVRRLLTTTLYTLPRRRRRRRNRRVGARDRSRDRPFYSARRQWTDRVGAVSRHGARTVGKPTTRILRPVQCVVRWRPDSRPSTRYLRARAREWKLIRRDRIERFFPSAAASTFLFFFTK